MPTLEFKERLLRNVDPSWRVLLCSALDEMDPNFLNSLECDSDWLPGVDSCFRAFFRVPRSAVRVVWLGESPYTKAARANGLSFYDAKVHDLFKENGELHARVNDARSLQYILKAWFVAIERRRTDQCNLRDIREMNKDNLITTLDDLFDRGQEHGWLWLNATLSLWLHANEVPSICRQIFCWRPLVEALLRDASSRGAKIVLLGDWAEVFAYMANNPLIAPHPAYRKGKNPYHPFIEHKGMRAFLLQWRCLIETDQPPPA